MVCNAFFSLQNRLFFFVLQASAERESRARRLGRATRTPGLGYD